MKFQITKIGLNFGEIHLEASGKIEAQADRIIFGKDIGILVNGTFSKAKVDFDKDDKVSFLIVSSSTYVYTNTKISEFPDF